MVPVGGADRVEQERWKCVCSSLKRRQRERERERAKESGSLKTDDKVNMHREPVTQAHLV